MLSRKCVLAVNFHPFIFYIDLNFLGELVYLLHVSSKRRIPFNITTASQDSVGFFYEKKCSLR